MNNKVLLGILCALIGVYAIYQLCAGNESRTFDTQIVNFSSSAVTRMIIKPKADSLRQFTVEKVNANWEAERNGKKYPANSEEVDEFLNNLSSLKASYIAAKSKVHWKDYELEEGLCTNIKVFAGNEELTNIYLGKFNPNPQTQQLTSFVRTGDHDDVLAVEGMATLMLNKVFDDFRDKTFLNFDLHKVDVLEFQGPENNLVQKNRDGWYLNNSEKLDSTKVINYLMNLQRMSGDDFAEVNDPSSTLAQPYRLLTIKGKGLDNDIVVKCWTNTMHENPYVLQSSQFPASFFQSDSLRIYKRIFKDISEW